jgi:hypothetical protein
MRCGVGIAAGDGGAAEVFHGLVEVLARLLAKNFAQQDAERAHIAAQGSFLQLAGGRLKLGQSLRPVGWGPKRGHRLLCPVRTGRKPRKSMSQKRDMGHRFRDRY